MRALIISDIHANLQAFEAVLTAAPKYDAVWNLGDIVGYGANPNESVELARTIGGIVVRGNHDRACSGKLRYSEHIHLSSNARYALDWTQKTLTTGNLQWLSRLPRGPVKPLGRKVVCVHGSPRDEDEYVFSDWSALAACRATRARIILCGHSHCQFGWDLYLRKRDLLRPNYQSNKAFVQFELQLCAEHRYVLNPGSVGQPRDRDWRAAFAVYDDEQLRFTWYRVPYKVLTAQKRIRVAGLPEVLAKRLREGK